MRNFYKSCFTVLTNALLLAVLGSCQRQELPTPISPPPTDAHSSNAVATPKGGATTNGLITLPTKTPPPISTEPYMPPSRGGGGGGGDGGRSGGDPGGGSSGTPGDTPDFQVYEQYYYQNRMTQSELAIYQRMSRAQQVTYLSNARDAENSAAIRCADFTQHNGVGDAFRHASFVAHNARSLYISRDLALQLSDAHEQDPRQDAIEQQMDLANNYAGYLIALDPTIATRDLDDTIFLWLLSGRLKIIENGKVVPSH